MKLFQTIIIFDVIAAANSEDAAKAALLALVRDQAEPQGVNEIIAREITQEREIRIAMRGAKPIVGADINDADFETIRGQTNMQMFERLYTKKAPTQ